MYLYTNDTNASYVPFNFIILNKSNVMGTMMSILRSISGLGSIDPSDPLDVGRDRFYLHTDEPPAFSLFSFFSPSLSLIHILTFAHNIITTQEYNPLCESAYTRMVPVFTCVCVCVRAHKYTCTRMCMVFGVTKRKFLTIKLNVQQHDGKVTTTMTTPKGIQSCLRI